MATEIERKFLVKGEFRNQAQQEIFIAQAYLSSVPERSVRVRIKGEKAFLTVKGKSSDSGMSRFEWEKEISVEEAKDLLAICEAGRIEKIRFEIPVGTHIFEVDEFFAENKGLVLAEVELNSENEVFEKPAWLGKEVTGDVRYYNTYLSKRPFCSWHEE